MIGPKGLKSSGIDEGHPGEIIRKFGNDRIKNMPINLFFFFFFFLEISWLWSELYT